MDLNLCFETERLLLRPLQESDARAVRQVLRRPEIYATTAGIPRDCSLSRVRWWIRYTDNSIRLRTGFELGVFGRSTGEYLGCTGLVNLRKEMKSASVAYHVNPDFWGQGIASEACRRIVRFGFETLELERIAGSCMAENTASRRVMEHAGFQPEGVARHELLKDGRFYDILHLSLLRNDWAAGCACPEPERSCPQ